MFGILIFYLLSESVIVELQYAEKDLKFETAEGLTRIRIEGLEITDLPGAPELPVQTIKVAIPYGARIKDVKIKNTGTTTILGKYELSWAQPPAILSMKKLPPRVGRNEEIYSAEALYPEDIIEFKGTGVCDNQQICEINIFPVQYCPALKELVFHKTIQLCVEYEGGIKLPAKKEIIKKMVTNPEDIPPKGELRERNNFRYLIITNPPLDTVFQRLADWKTKKGLLARVRTTNWIYSNYPGEDNAAKIRNYLKTLPDSSVEYVLLGGDIDFIPCRFAYAMDCSAGYYPGREDTMPADLYYADLQGDWDLDNDGSYGEIEDSIDLYPDLFIGRAPVNTIAEAQKFVEKVLTYEKNPPLDYLNNVLFAAEILWNDPYTDQGVHKNKIENESFSPNFTLTKLYQSLGNETREAVMQAIRDGNGLINHDGHGWIDLISVGGWPHRIYATDFDTITNSPRYGILYSIGCWTNAFDFAAISEAFVNSPQGGGVAYIGNSSYGWGSPGNPGFGYSDRFDSRFFYSLLKEDNFHLGVALSLAKAHFIPYSREKNVYRWHQYQINLLGDPELPVWTQTPETLAVSYPQILPLGNAQILITVKEKETNSPIKDALVCLMKGNESYAAGYTNGSGSVFLDISPQTVGNFDLTVTAHNYLPFETTIPVVSGSYVNFNNWIINDIFGNNDQIANPGEHILLTIMIKNCGNTPANNIQLVLRSSDPNVFIADSIAFTPNLLPGDSLLIENAFAITIDTVPDHYCLAFDLQITDNHQTLHFF
ncbi:MAG: C25 family cysteine peptidase, partial [candidate division WOR-3 bacterium]